MLYAETLQEASRNLADMSATDREGESLETQFAYSREFFDVLGNPQDTFPSIHVAGTSGKGSTTHYMSAMLETAGLHIGTMTSPHISDVRERAKLDLALPGEERFIEAANYALAGAEVMDANGRGRPRFDELFAAVSLLIFQGAEVEYAVIETDMGGRFDATNAINRNDKQAVITNLGLDHEGALGSTIEAIAWQKAGIIRPGGQTTAFLPPAASVRGVLDAEAEVKHAALSYVDPPAVTSNVNIDCEGITFDYDSPDGFSVPELWLPTIASYQVKNAALAIASVRMLAERDGLNITPENVRAALGQTRIPARLEVTSVEGRDLIIDGSTNPQKLGSFVRALQDAGVERPVWVFGAGIHKDHEEMFSIIGEHSAGIVFSNYDREAAPHCQGKSADARELAAIWRTRTDIPCYGAEDSVNEAVATACAATPDGAPLAMAGSIYMIGEFDREAA